MGAVALGVVLRSTLISIPIELGDKCPIVAPRFTEAPLWLEPPDKLSLPYELVALAKLDTLVK